MLYRQSDLFLIMNALIIHRNVFQRRLSDLQIKPDYREFCERKLADIDNLIQKVRKDNETRFQTSSK